MPSQQPWQFWPSSGRWSHRLKLIPVTGKLGIRVEVWIIAHDIFAGTIEPRVVILAAEFHGLTIRWITEGLHTANVLVCLQKTLPRCASRVGTHLHVRLRDVLLKLGIDLIDRGLFF